MTPPGFLETFEATWPPASSTQLGPWTIRDGQGGGKRVSAATRDALEDVGAGEFDAAEDAMRNLGQAPLFRLADDDRTTDRLLADRGYDVLDRTVLLYGAIRDLKAAAPPPLTAIPAWPPLAVMRELWDEGGINAARLQVMERAAAPKTALLGRLGDKPQGVVFISTHRGIAMIHALEVAPPARRKGVARRLIEGAVAWASDNGAEAVGLAVTEANRPARRLYSGLGFSEVGRYHYRMIRNKGA